MVYKMTTPEIALNLLKFKHRGDIDIYQPL